MARRIKELADYGIGGSDLGVECADCRTMTVYCPFDAQKAFTERQWSVAPGEAISRFRCRCGSTRLRFRPVPISRRPKPIPKRPDPLRPIYREDCRSLLKRGPSPFPDEAAIHHAVGILKSACGSDVPGHTDKVKAAMQVLRPHLYGAEALDTLWHALSPSEKKHPWNHTPLMVRGIERQLGLIEDEP